MHPSFSPDGSQIVYTVMPPAGGAILNKMYLVPSQGGDSKPFQPDFGVSSSMAMGPEPLWSPDGKYLLFAGVHANEARSFDWWVAPVAGGEPVRTGALANIRSPQWIWIYPTAWSGNRVIFSAGASPSEDSGVFSVRIAPGTWRIPGPSTRLISAAGHNTVSSAAADGRIAMNAIKSVAAVYSLVLDAKRGTVTAPPERLTHDETIKAAPAVSRDGSRVAWYTLTTRPAIKMEIHARETIDGRESVLAGRSSAFLAVPATKLNVDGSALAYLDFFGGRYHAFLVAGRSGTPREICESCQIQSFFPDPDKAIVQYGAELVRQDFSGGARSPVLKWNSGQILDADVSPDGSWVAVSLTRNSGSNAIFLVPLRGAPAPERDWVLAAEADYVLDSPGWSADGNLLYCMSERDGRTCIWAQRLEPGTRKPAGPAFEVYHENRARFVFVSRRWRKVAVARDRLLTVMAENTGNIWLATLGPE